eukprot:GILJ01008488.1.p2 GENE.GILJ01008488.1~~GILJ01008488.1.p2  ORF type:complete len:271 (-),score=53.90 GILJ01008488.1:311-1123(-)
MADAQDYVADFESEVEEDVASPRSENLNIPGVNLRRLSDLLSSQDEDEYADESFLSDTSARSNGSEHGEVTAFGSKRTVEKSSLSPGWRSESSKKSPKHVHFVPSAQLASISEERADTYGFNALPLPLPSQPPSSHSPSLSEQGPTDEQILNIVLSSYIDTLQQQQQIQSTDPFLDGSGNTNIALLVEDTIKKMLRNSTRFFNPFPYVKSQFRSEINSAIGVEVGDDEVESALNEVVFEVFTDKQILSIIRSAVINKLRKRKSKQSSAID